jgi:oligoribonuclease NrnB/cAMP/cGMP phosphodiesterase (DHH superfamily)
MLAQILNEKKRQINVYFHGNGCSDGLTAAAIFTKYYPNLKYKAVSPGFRLTAEDSESSLIFLDVCCNVVDICKINLEYFYIIDHHETTSVDLKKIPEKNKLIDINHCAAYLTWKIFNIDVKIPYSIELIEDRDLWLCRSKNIHEFNARLDANPKRFQISYYRNIVFTPEFLIQELKKGSDDLKKKNMAIEAEMPKLVKKSYSIKIDGAEYKYMVGFLTTRIFKNDIANKIASENKDLDFAVVYSSNINQHFYCLRSARNKTDVSIIARALGGGGHKFASGIVIIGNKIPNFP